MDKEKLEKAILSCKPAVLKAKVRIVRKLIKKINILQKCKDPALKEKKLKKASRVLEEMILINRLKVFDVMSFALKTKNLEDALKTPSNERLHACAAVAKFKDVGDHVNKLRKKFKNETELSSLLDSLEEGRRRKKRMQAVTKKTEKKDEKLVKKKKKTKVKAKPNLEKENVKNGEMKKEVKNNKLNNDPKISENMVRSKKMKKIQVKDGKKSEAEAVQIQSDSKEIINVSLTEFNIEKVDDPFFVGKKVIKPKFVDTENDQNDDSENENSNISENNHLKQRSKDSLWKMTESRDSGPSKNFSNKKPEKRKSGATHKPLVKEEDLHPSWAAKKSIQVIQPFQGKKIKFDD